MANLKFNNEMETLDSEMEEALLLDPNSSETGRAARAYWNFVSRCVEEGFGIITTADNTGRLYGSEDQIAEALKEAEAEIARGFQRLAVLLADPNIEAELRDEFQQQGIVHPFNSHIGFRVRNHPKVDKKLRRFFDKQERRGKSLDQIMQDLRLWFDQIEE